MRRYGGKEGRALEEVLQRMQREEREREQRAEHLRAIEKSTWTGGEPAGETAGPAPGQRPEGVR
jgi:hypothetical protein